jgi:CubicO group peptidase (beta-lactamase class C family)
MSTVSRFARILLGSGILLVGILLVIFLSEPLFWKRLLTFPATDSVTAVEWYQPSETVAGTERRGPEPAEDAHRSVSQDALDAAVRYGTETGSVALLVWHRGSLELEHYWPGYGRQTRTDSGGMHATVLALLYGAAIGEGVIRSLDEPAATYLPEWRNDAHAKIRIRDLLMMASGLEHQPPSRNPWNRAVRLFLSGNITPLALGAPVHDEPGTHFEYSNLDAQLLGIILQRASGKRYASYLSEHIWSRLGAGDGAVWLDQQNGMARTFCCLQATARGWLGIGLTILNLGAAGDEQIVPAAWVQEMLQPSEVSPNFGLEIWLGDVSDAAAHRVADPVSGRQSQPFLAGDVAFLAGAGGQRVYIIPSHEIIIVRTGARRTDWDDAKLPNAILRGVS